ncbi:unnamed protein product [Ilex paraguariensis]|uniref:C2H2-type domain-containing protein n=1 Tax=Ilex paraguariensis TaxID=185542 RepID=A0ABC8RR32_9AQUA
MADWFSTFDSTNNVSFVNHQLINHASSGVNNVQESGFGGNQLAAYNKNGYIHLHDPSRQTFGQLGVSQRVSGYQQFLSSAKRIRNNVTGTHQVAGHSAVFQSVVQVNGHIIREHVFTMVSRQHIDISSSNLALQNQSNFVNMGQDHVNRVPDLITRSELYNVQGHQTPNKAPNPSDFFDSKEHQADGFVDASPISMRFPAANVEIPFGDQLGKTSSDLNLNESSNNLVEAPIRLDRSVHRHNHTVEGGQGHDFAAERRQPYKKYGPYACPRCSKISTTSQHHAAHMRWHYDSEETLEERKRRQESKYKKKNLRLVQTSDGLTVVPDLFTGMMGNIYSILPNGPQDRKPNLMVGRETKAFKEEPDFEMAVEHKIPYGGVVIKDEPQN